MKNNSGKEKDLQNGWNYGEVKGQEKQHDLKKNYDLFNQENREAFSWPFLKEVTLREVKGVFTKNELGAIIAIYNAYIFDYELYAKSSKKLLLMRLQNANRYECLFLNWKIEENILDKVGSLTSVQAFFIAEWANHFWYENENEVSFENWISTLE